MRYLLPYESFLLLKEYFHSQKRFLNERKEILMNFTSSNLNAPKSIKINYGDRSVVSEKDLENESCSSSNFSKDNTNKLDSLKKTQIRKETRAEADRSPFWIREGNFNIQKNSKSIKIDTESLRTFSQISKIHELPFSKIHKRETQKIVLNLIQPDDHLPSTPKRVSTTKNKRHRRERVSGLGLASITERNANKINSTTEFYRMVQKITKIQNREQRESIYSNVMNKDNKKENSNKIESFNSNSNYKNTKRKFESIANDSRANYNISNTFLDITKRSRLHNRGITFSDSKEFTSRSRKLSTSFIEKSINQKSSKKGIKKHKKRKRAGFDIFNNGVYQIPQRKLPLLKKLRNKSLEIKKKYDFVRNAKSLDFGKRKIEHQKLKNKLQREKKTNNLFNKLTKKKKSQIMQNRHAYLDPENLVGKLKDITELSSKMFIMKMRRKR